MLKTIISVKEGETRAVDALKSLLAQIPAIKLRTLELESRSSNAEVDLIGVKTCVAFS
jgi:hypothetical protein